ncbi:MAG: SURF1 family protein [Nocardioidaceae bacterium]|nr:SURF1 family protein [Nocardioidaceae bacterium]
MLALHALLILVLLGTALLGWWQWDAWRSEQADNATELLGRSPVALSDALGPDDPPAGEDIGIPVVAEGRYAPADEQFLVPRRNTDGKAGYWVLSPLRIEETGSSLLVVRGWTAQASPLPPVPTGPVRETGVLQPGEEGSGTVSPERMVAAVRIPALVGQTGGDLYGAFLLRMQPRYADPAAGRLEPVPPPVAGPAWSAGLRNLAYAAQWWVFGGFALVLWWRMCVDRLAAARLEDATEPQVPSPT